MVTPCVAERPRGRLSFDNGQASPLLAVVDTLRSTAAAFSGFVAGRMQTQVAASLPARMRNSSPAVRAAASNAERWTFAPMVERRVLSVTSMACNPFGELP